MRRPIVALWGVCLAGNVGAAVLNAVAGSAWAFLSAACAAWCLFMLVAEVRRGNRRTARDRHDPDLTAGTLIGPNNLALGSAFTTGSLAIAGSIGAADPGLTETVADVPILAFKRCHLRWSEGGRFSLVANHTGVPVTLDADARCQQSYYALVGAVYGGGPARDHTSPDVQCSCGFYAVKDIEQLCDGYGVVKLDVELSGRVIVATNGYRAGHQRVLRAAIDGCYYCGEPIEAFAVGVSTIPPGVMISGGSSNVQALCRTHVGPGVVTVSPEIVTARLGVPFDLGSR